MDHGLIKHQNDMMFAENNEASSDLAIKRTLNKFIERQALLIYRKMNK